MTVSLTDMVLKCAACGQCRAVCPSFEASGLREPDSPRGRVLLARDLLSGLVPWTRGAVGTLSGCLLCSSCVEECPSDVPVDDVVLLARMSRAQAAGLPPARRALNHVFSRPSVMAALARAGALVTGRRGMKWPPLSRAGRLLPAPSRVSLSRQVRSVGTPTFLFFRGCLIEHVTTEIGQALVGLSRLAGQEPGLPPGEACCGIPVLASGDVDGFGQIASRNLDVFGDGDLPIVTACATCTSVLRKYYVRYAPEGMEEKAERMAARVIDAVEFVSGLNLPEPSRSLGSFTYHQPCHHEKGQAVKIDGSLLLEKSGAVEYVAAGDRSTCCGFGGSYSLDNYPKARQLGENRLSGLAATGAGGVATGCPGCLIHLRDAAAGMGSDLQVLHVLEVLWQAAG